MPEINQEIKEEYEKIKDKISYDEFIKEMKTRMQDYEEVSFMGELDVARVIVGEYVDEENKPLSENAPVLKIADLNSGNHNISLIGRVKRISNVKKFTNRKGREGKLANLLISDDTGEIRVVLWTENIKLLKKFQEGDVIKITSVEIKQGFRSDEAHLNKNSTIEKLPEEEYSTLPPYEEKITDIKDLKEDMEVNVIARIIRIPRTRTFDRNGKEGKFVPLEIQDKSGKTTLTLWNKDTELLETLDIQEGDSIKVLGAQSRARNGEISLSHFWLGRIIKGDYEVPEYKESVVKIGDAHEMRDVTIFGVVSKIYDTITFVRDDASTGQVRSLEIEDNTGKIRVTMWNDDTKIEMKKGDVIKITGGNIEFDEFSGTNYRINTNWNTIITVNPPLEKETKEMLNECGKYLKPVKIGDLNTIEDEGEEVDIVGRVINLLDPNQFDRDDGSKGLVRSAEIADDSGVVRTSFWDEKAESSLSIGEAIKIENARTRMGTYDIELSVGKTSRLIQPTAEELKNLPSLTEIEKSIYQNKNIEELKEGDRDVRLIGRILSVEEPNEFVRSDGTPGVVRSIEIGDHTGVVRASLWDDKASTPLNEGDVFKIENPRVNLRNDHLELSLSRNTPLIKADEEESSKIPSINEIQEKRYPKKKIDEIEENDRNIKVTGKVIEAYGNKILYEMCPNCNKRVNMTENGYICEICGEEIEQPNYLMIIPLVIEDETGTMRTTFFRKSAEELIELTTPEVEEIIKKTGDEGSLEDKVSDLIEMEITIIANASFDEYNEEIRLNARKLVEKNI
ncbi:MAG TPA: OB-fold nucleic acid binding domain-containing protein [Methanobacterium sp.]|nr:OB-fold nucleic acid binding domain-containing protein [Methanobacterium sp.]